MFDQTVYVGSFVTLLCLWVLRWKFKRLRFPPGPRHFPLYGSEFRRTHMHQADNFARFAEQFRSDIIGIKEWGSCTIVLSSFDAVSDILIRKSNHTAGRPPPWRQFRDWGGLHTSIPHLDYGGIKFSSGFSKHLSYFITEGWRARRQTFSHLVSPSKLPDYAPLQVTTTRNMLLSLLNKPEMPVLHFHEMIGQIILTLVYGIAKLPKGRSHLGLAEHALGGILFTFTLEFQVACLLNDLSRWVPLPEWLFPVMEKCRVNREVVESQTYVPYDETKRQMINDNVTSSFVTDILRSSNVDAELDIVLRDAAGSLYSGAVIATGSLLFTFMMAMAWFPDAQAKAQKELDTIIGHGNLPTESICNQSNIPYTFAVIMEMMRWRPPVWMGLDHSNDVDMEYNGYSVPARSALVVNLKTILHDPNRFEDPQDFRPARFLKPNGEFDPSVFDPRQVIFGFGRRTCPGRGIAFTSLVIAAASTLSCFDIVSCHDLDQRRAAIALFLATDIPWKFPHGDISMKVRSEQTAHAIKSAVQSPEM